MMSEETLDSILNGDGPTAEPEAEVETEAEEVEVEAEAEATEEVEAEAETEPETSTAEVKEAEPWTKTAYLSEKKKRQALEQKLAEAEQKPLPDVIEDQAGFTQGLREELSQAVSGIKTELSQELMRELHDDYDEREAQFLTLAEDNPALIEELSAARNPARYAYETAVKHEELQQLKNVDEYKAKLKAELEAEIRAEVLGEKESKDAKKAEKEEALKPSIVGAGESGTDTVVESELEDILGEDAMHRK